MPLATNWNCWNARTWGREQKSTSFLRNEINGGINYAIARVQNQELQPFNFRTPDAPTRDTWPMRANTAKLLRLGRSAPTGLQESSTTNLRPENIDQIDHGLFNRRTASL